MPRRWPRRWSRASATAALAWHLPPAGGGLQHQQGRSRTRCRADPVRTGACAGPRRWRRWLRAIGLPDRQAAADRKGEGQRHRRAGAEQRRSFRRALARGRGTGGGGPRRLGLHAQPCLGRAIGRGRARVWTNPIAFGWPRPDGPPFVFDFATSMVARGEIELHRRAGKNVPDDWVSMRKGSRPPIRRRSCQARCGRSAGIRDRHWPRWSNCSPGR